MLLEELNSQLRMYKKQNDELNSVIQKLKQQNRTIGKQLDAKYEEMIADLEERAEEYKNIIVTFFYNSGQERPRDPDILQEVVKAEEVAGVVKSRFLAIQEVPFHLSLE